MSRSFNFNETAKLNGIRILCNQKNCTARSVTKRIKQILDAEYEKINLESMVMNLNYLKDNNKYSLSEIWRNVWRILGKCTGSDYTIELMEDAKPFPIPNHSGINS